MGWSFSILAIQTVRLLGTCEEKRFVSSILVSTKTCVCSEYKVILCDDSFNHRIGKPP